MDEIKLSDGFWKTFKDSASLELISDISEVGLDTLMEGPFKDIPIFGSFLKIWQAQAQIRDFLFFNKLVRFLKHIREGNVEAAISYAEKIKEDENFRTRVCTNILSAIEQLNDIDKTELLARAFLCLASGQISYDTFCEFTLIIDRCLIADLRYLKDTEKSIKLPPPVATRLSSCGLVEVVSMTLIRAEDDKTNDYLMTSLGRGFLRMILINPFK